MWSCKATAKYRSILPSTTMEERLLLPTRPWPPPPLPRQLSPVPPSHVLRLVQTTLIRSPTHATFATDGGSRDHLASWAVASCFGNAADQIRGEDYSSFSAEIEALQALLQAILACWTAHPPESDAIAHIFVDCKPAIGLGFAQRPPVYRTETWSRLRALCHDIRRLGRLLIEWIPSHGKHSYWKPVTQPPAHIDPRKLNDDADLACTAILNHLAASPPHVAALTAAYRAQLWEREAIRTAVSLIRPVLDHVHGTVFAAARATSSRTRATAPAAASAEHEAPSTDSARH